MTIGVVLLVVGVSVVDECGREEEDGVEMKIGEKDTLRPDFLFRFDDGIKTSDISPSGSLPSSTGCWVMRRGFLSPSTLGF